MRDTISIYADCASSGAVIVLVFALLVVAAADDRAIRAAIFASIGSPVVFVALISLALKLGWIGE